VAWRAENGEGYEAPAALAADRVVLTVREGSVLVLTVRRDDGVAGVIYDPATFSRDLKATGLIRTTGDVRQNDGGRPAALYQFASHQPQWGAGRRKRVRS
jgi:hypothetical protein